jgi:hypothetical protein
MLDIEKDTAKRIIDALAVAMEPLANPGRFSTRLYFRSDKMAPRGSCARRYNDPSG